MAEGARRKVCIRQRIGGSNPLTAIFEMRACTQVRALFFYILRRGDENPRPGFDNWQRQLDRPRACERAAPQGRAKRVNPPLTAIFEMRACTQVRALFFIFSAGDENPDRGSTTGNASWTDREPASGLPQGERSESIPPSPPYSR